MKSDEKWEKENNKMKRKNRHGLSGPWNWNAPFNLLTQSIKIHANRNRHLIQISCFFFNIFLFSYLYQIVFQFGVCDFLSHTTPIHQSSCIPHISLILCQKFLLFLVLYNHVSIPLTLALMYYGCSFFVFFYKLCPWGHFDVFNYIPRCFRFVYSYCYFFRSVLFFSSSFGQAMFQPLTFGFLCSVVIIFLFPAFDLLITLSSLFILHFVTFPFTFSLYFSYFLSFSLNADFHVVLRTFLEVAALLTFKGEWGIQKYIH